jgi:seryl-tRNA synthetase
VQATAAADPRTGRTDRTAAHDDQAARKLDAARSAFRGELFEAGLLVPTGIDGLYLRAEGFEAIARAIDALVSAACRDEVDVTLHFPLVMARHLLETTDYLKSFPQLAGTVSSFDGGDAEHRALLREVDAGVEWAGRFAPTDLGLCSAACHPLYPTETGRLPEGGRLVEVFGNCFRHEPSIDPARMQIFRQHEVVYLGDPEGARAHRDRWVQRGLEIHGRLGLDVEAVVANDPFFGRAGDLLAAGQRSEALKIELVSPICSVEEPTAITSANCHLDHFGSAFDISTADGEVAHSACVGFGTERIVLAMLRTHGLHPASWPAPVRSALGW